MCQRNAKVYLKHKSCPAIKWLMVWQSVTTIVPRQKRRWSDFRISATITSLRFRRSRTSHSMGSGHQRLVHWKKHIRINSFAALCGARGQQCAQHECVRIRKPSEYSIIVNVTCQIRSVAADTLNMTKHMDDNNSLINEPFPMGFIVFLQTLCVLRERNKRQWKICLWLYPLKDCFEAAVILALITLGLGQSAKLKQFQYGKY